MKIHRLQAGLVAEQDGELRTLTGLSLDEIFEAAAPAAILKRAWSESQPKRGELRGVLAPIASQEVWAAGVTYFRSRTARMEESEASGGASFYDKVYEAARPELFFKSTATRVVSPGGQVRIRPDSTWDVPEPELTLAINRRGRVFGYTLGNDMSSRSIEGENPLYLPQAKVYDGSCSLGPALLIADEPPPPETKIELAIARDGKEVFAGAVELAQIKRRFDELATWLFKELSFPYGALLMTGTGIVPDHPFTLRSGDRVSITCAPIGSLVNTVA